jgi:uncharacterized damage-inducible protein DinB
VTDDLRFPIGDFRPPATTTEAERLARIDQIEAAPARLREAVVGLGPEQIETPYRPGGWTVRQVVHHVPDSHLNGYVRFRLALTEDEPTIKPYQEERWAELPDARSAPLEVSLDMLDALHRRWTRLLRSLAPSDWERRYRHPELGLVSLERTLALYAWHGRHHVAHVTSLRDRRGWH